MNFRTFKVANKCLFVGTDRRTTDDGPTFVRNYFTILSKKKTHIKSKMMFDLQKEDINSHSQGTWPQTTIF